MRFPQDRHLLSQAAGGAAADSVAATEKARVCALCVRREGTHAGNHFAEPKSGAMPGTKCIPTALPLDSPVGRRSDDSGNGSR